MISAAARGLSFSIHAQLRSKQGFIDWPADASGIRHQLCAGSRHIHCSKTLLALPARTTMGADEKSARNGVHYATSALAEPSTATPPVSLTKSRRLMACPNAKITNWV
jgi:hypothetical protein